MFQGDEGFPPANSGEVSQENLPLQLHLQTLLSVLEVAPPTPPRQPTGRGTTAGNGGDDLYQGAVVNTSSLLPWGKLHLLARKSPVNEVGLPLNTDESLSPFGQG